MRLGGKDLLILIIIQYLNEASVNILRIEIFSIFNFNDFL